MKNVLMRFAESVLSKNEMKEVKGGKMVEICSTPRDGSSGGGCGTSFFLSCSNAQSFVNNLNSQNDNYTYNVTSGC